MEKNAEFQKKEPLWTRDFILISIASLFITMGF